jgi:hypothetical protein
VSKICKTIYNPKNSKTDALRILGISFGIVLLNIQVPNNIKIQTLNIKIRMKVIILLDDIVFNSIDVVKPCLPGAIDATKLDILETNAVAIFILSII